MQHDDDEEDDVSPWRPVATHGMSADEVRTAILNAARAMFSFTPATWAAQVAAVDAMVPRVMNDMAASAGDDPNGGPPALH